MTVYKASVKYEGKIHTKIVADSEEEAISKATSKKDWMAEYAERPAIQSGSFEVEEIVDYVEE